MVHNESSSGTHIRHSIIGNDAKQCFKCMVFVKGHNCGDCSGSVGSGSMDAMVCGGGKKLQRISLLGSLVAVFLT